MTLRLARALVWLYPSKWRDRYAEEFTGFPSQALEFNTVLLAAAMFTNRKRPPHRSPTGCFGHGA